MKKTALIGINRQILFPNFYLLLAMSYNSPISRFCPSGDASYGERSRAVGAAIGHDVRVLAKDADTDRMRRARAASRSTRSCGIAEHALAPISRPKPHEGFLRDVGASASRAARSSPRPGRVWRDAMCCVRPRTSRTSRPDKLFVATRHCVIYSK